MLSDLMLPPILGLILGAVLLVAGRRLFWLAVGAAGFLVGLRLGLRLVPEPDGLHWLVAILLGLGGMVLAKAFQKLAVALVGFFAGGATLVELLHAAGIHRPGDGIIFLIAGVIAAALALWLFEAALVVLSSGLGAVLVVDALHLHRAALMILLLFAIGVAVQMSYEPRRRRAT